MNRTLHAFHCHCFLIVSRFHARVAPSASSTKRQLRTPGHFCLDKLFIHSPGRQMGGWSWSSPRSSRLSGNRATSPQIGAVTRSMMERRVAQRNHFSSRPSIIIGGVSGRKAEAGRQPGRSLKCEWLYPEERSTYFSHTEFILLGSSVVIFLPPLRADRLAKTQVTQETKVGEF